MIVRVYWNLHQHCWSLQGRPPSVKRPMIIGHAQMLHLHDCTFIVNEGGRKRVLIQQRKNVHAFVEGTIGTACINPGRWTKIRYNPYECGFFHRYRDRHLPVGERREYLTADRVLLTEIGEVKAAGLTFVDPVLSSGSEGEK